MTSPITLGVIVIVIICSFILLWFAIRTHVYQWAVINHFSKIQFGHLSIVDAKTNTLLCDIQRPNAKKKMHDARRATIFVQGGELFEFFSRLAHNGETALGEMYMEGLWTTDNLYNLLMILVGNKDYLPDNGHYAPVGPSVGSDSKDIQHHYDVGNDFYATFLLDDFMTYSCAFWFSPEDDLNSAQYNKINTIIRKMGLPVQQENTMRVLDVGCGWGRLAKYVSEQTGAHVTGVTISQEQVAFINAGGGSNVEGKFCHYIEMPETLGRNVFDRAYSIGMLEHVRCANFDTFFKAMYEVMKPDGIFVLHCITTDRDDSTCESGAKEYFVTKHIFPGGQIPKNEWVLRSSRRCGFTLLHLETFNGIHYAKTLRAWRENMYASVGKLLQVGYDEVVLRKYDYYFTVCEALFLHNQLQVSHFVLQKV